MSNLQIEVTVAKSVPLAIAAFEPGISAEERLARTRAALEALRGISEE